MTGRLYLTETSCPVEAHVRLSLDLDRDLPLHFHDPRKFGRVWMVDDPAEITANLEPDALKVEFAEFSARSSAFGT